MGRPIAFRDPSGGDASDAELKAQDAGAAEEARRAEIHSAMTARRNRKAVEEKAADLLAEAGIEPPSGSGINRENGKPDEYTNGKKPTLPVRKTSGLVFPDGNGMGPLPAPKPQGEEVAKMTRIPQKDANRRMAICQACPELIALDRCKRCGCFMRIKTQIPSAQCPLQKW